MIACRQCNAVYADPAPRFCGRCGADLRLAAQSPDASDGEQVADPGGGEEVLVGRVIAGRYRVLEKIGSGGMGVVYRVEHTSIGKIAALKMLRPSLSAQRDLVKRFRLEARAVSLLTHPHTVQVFDFGEADGSLFMVMELVRGEDLGTLLDRKGPLPWSRVAPLLSQICEALAEAHEAGIIHRDIKPENILVSRGREGRETVKVLDFGLAKLRERPDIARVTGRGTLIGTPFYMSPEQIRGEDLDARSDIYSLGALAYRLLTGTYPFDGTSPVAVLTSHITDPYVPMSERRPDLALGPHVEALVARALARDPAARYAGADEMRQAVSEARQAPALGAVPVALLVERSGIQSSTPAPAPSVVPQLSREDLDRFERNLRVRLRVRLALLFFFLASASGAGVYAFLKADRQKPVTNEIEPNNEAREANLIDNGRVVRGTIGKPLGLAASDRDYFHFHIERGPAVLRLVLTGVPDRALHLSVFTTLGDKIAEAAAGGAGTGEVIPNLRLDAGEYDVSVREAWVSGGAPAENLRDPYTLRATWFPLAADEETEPDDTPAQALAIPLDRAIHGYLGTENDVDFFYPRGDPGGELAGRVSGIPGVDVRIVVLPPGSTAGADPSSVRGARVFDGGGPGAPEVFSRVPWAAGGAAPLVVVMRKDRVEAAGHHVEVVGVDVPYLLLVQRTDPGAHGGESAAIPVDGAGRAFVPTITPPFAQVQSGAAIPVGGGFAVPDLPRAPGASSPAARSATMTDATSPAAPSPLPPGPVVLPAAPMPPSEAQEDAPTTGVTDPAGAGATVKSPPVAPVAPPPAAAPAPTAPAPSDGGG